MLVDVLGVVQLYALAMVLLLVFREVFRRRAYVYASRRQLTSTRLAKLGQRATGLERHARDHKAAYADRLCR